MAWWQWVVGILMFILALGVLVGIHELGHLGAAKMFHVYCVDYSIGFGPKLLQSKKSKKHETTWTLRAIPLGGFVAMYGEGMELEGNEYIPPSRSLEGVARYKRAIIISAGVFLNFVLGFVLIFCHNAFFPHISFSFGSMYNVDGNQYANAFVTSSDESLGLKADSAVKFYIDPLAKVKISNNQTTSVFFLDKDVDIGGTKYVLCLKNIITTTKVDPDISLSLGLYKQITPTEQIDKTISAGFTNSLLESIILTNEKISLDDKEKVKQVEDEINKLSGDARNNKFKEVTLKYYSNIGDVSIDGDVMYNVASNTPDSTKYTLTYYEKGDDGKYIKDTKQKELTLKPNSSKNGWDTTGIRLKRNVERYSFAKSMKVSGQEWCSANSAIFRALGNIFTGNLSNLGGPIAIAQVSSTVLSNFGFERYLYLWGQISCNLAIINLLPFPGLDGWSLLVIGYEAIRKKQIPMKVKAIISVVGLILLFGLMFVILIKDIVGIVA